MTHIPERTFEDSVEAWFVERYGRENVERQYYQRGVRWFVDLLVRLPYGTLYIELESRASEVRNGVSQALGYAAEDPEKGIPMVVVPAGHLDEERTNRLRQSSTVVIREFDEERRTFV